MDSMKCPFCNDTLVEFIPSDLLKKGDEQAYACMNWNCLLAKYHPTLKELEDPEELEKKVKYIYRNEYFVKMNPR